MQQQMANGHEEGVESRQDMASPLDAYCGHHRRVLDDGQWFYPFGSGAVTEAHRRATDGGELSPNEGEE